MTRKDFIKRALDSIGPEVKQKLARDATQRVGAAVGDLYRLASNRTVRLAVTGLSRSGKSVFITSLVNQLVEASQEAHRLARLRVLQEGRLLGCREVLQADSTVATFRYDQHVDTLRGAPPQWPESTTDITQLRLQIRTRPKGVLDQFFTHYQELFVDIIDYPGEWLVDLPILQDDFARWSEKIFHQAEARHLAQYSAPWREYLAEQDHSRAARREEIDKAHALFRDYLLAAKAQGYNYLQPGRVVLPGQLAGSPAVTFCACRHPDGEPHPESLYRQLATRFSMYQRDVIQPFYRQHFSRFDCQVVLTDLMYALQQGPEFFADTQQTLNTLLANFSHGRSDWLRRLFSPRIDRILFAATKVDQVNLAQYEHLQRLLQSMLKPTLKRANFSSVKAMSLAMAAVRATETVVDHEQGEKRQYVRGRLLEEPFSAPPQELYYPPGAVPSVLPDADSWREQPFEFYAFHPPELDRAEPLLPHINMDAALEFLLGDKL